MSIKTEMIRDAKQYVGGASFMSVNEVAGWRREDRSTVQRKLKDVQKRSGKYFIPEIAEIFAKGGCEK